MPLCKERFGNNNGWKKQWITTTKRKEKMNICWTQISASTTDMPCHNKLKYRVRLLDYDMLFLIPLISLEFLDEVNAFSHFSLVFYLFFKLGCNCGPEHHTEKQNYLKYKNTPSKTNQIMKIWINRCHIIMQKPIKDHMTDLTLTS